MEGHEYRKGDVKIKASTLSPSLFLSLSTGWYLNIYFWWHCETATLWRGLGETYALPLFLLLSLSLSLSIYLSLSSPFLITVWYLHLYFNAIVKTATLWRGWWEPERHRLSLSLSHSSSLSLSLSLVFSSLKGDTWILNVLGKILL